jgi:hypothetical protein
MVREQQGVDMSLRDQVTFVGSVIDGVVKITFKFRPTMRGEERIAHNLAQIKYTTHSKAGSSIVIPQGNNGVCVYVRSNAHGRPGQRPLERDRSKPNFSQPRFCSIYYLVGEGRLVVSVSHRPALGGELHAGLPCLQWRRRLSHPQRE